MVSVKKLVTSFLLLAALASSVTLIFLNAHSEEYQKNEEGALFNDTQGSENQPVKSGESAFVESVPEPLESISQNEENQDVLLEGDLPPAINSSNLTENLAQNLTREILKTNPTGPAKAGEDFGLVIPEDSALKTAASLSVIGSDLVEEITEENSKINENYSEADLNAYVEAVNKILAGTTNSSEYKALTEQEPGLEMIGAARLIFDQAVGEVSVLEVPAPLTRAHKQLLVFLTNQQKIFEAGDNYKVDPLKTVLAFESADAIIRQDFRNFLVEFKKINFPKQVSRVEAKNELSLFEKFLGLKEAEALIFVPVECAGPSCTTFQITETAATTGNLIKRIWEAVRKFFTEELKNRLVHMIVQQTINWIQGGRKPKFVEDWKGFLKQTGDRAAGYVIQQVEPGLCRNIGPAIKVLLLPKQRTSGMNLGIRTSCTLTQVVRNVEAFGRRFENGGWIAYGRLLKPQNTLFGGLIEVSDIIMRESGLAKESENAKSQASQGFLGTRVCIDEASHNVRELVWLGAVAPVAATEENAVAIARHVGEEYIEGTLDTATGDFRACPPNGWRTTTPGRAVGETLYKALGAPLDKIINSQDLIGLMAALVDSALNKLLHAGAEGLRSAVSGTAWNPFNPDGTRVTPTPGIVSLCDGLTGSSHSSCLTLAGESQQIENRNSATSTPGLGGLEACANLTGQVYQDCLRNSGVPGVVTSTPPVNQVPIVDTFTFSPNPVNLAPPPFGVPPPPPPTLTISATDPDNPAGITTLTYVINWGDGNIITRARANGDVLVIGHNYNVVGTYTLKITITDVASGVTTAQRSIIVVFEP